MAAKIDSPESKPTGKFYRIESGEFLFVSGRLGLTLYPGTYAMVTAEEWDRVDPTAKQLITCSEVPEADYTRLRHKGVLGAAVG